MEGRKGAGREKTSEDAPSCDASFGSEPASFAADLPSVMGTDAPASTASAPAASLLPRVMISSPMASMARTASSASVVTGSSCASWVYMPLSPSSDASTEDSESIVSAKSRGRRGRNSPRSGVLVKSAVAIVRLRRTAPRPFNGTQTMVRLGSCANSDDDDEQGLEEHPFSFTLPLTGRRDSVPLTGRRDSTTPLASARLAISDRRDSVTPLVSAQQLSEVSSVGTASALGPTDNAQPEGGIASPVSAVSGTTDASSAVELTVRPLPGSSDLGMSPTSVDRSSVADSGFWDSVSVIEQQQAQGLLGTGNHKIKYSLDDDEEEEDDEEEWDEEEDYTDSDEDATAPASPERLVATMPELLRDDHGAIQVTATLAHTAPAAYAVKNRRSSMQPMIVIRKASQDTDSPTSDDRPHGRRRGSVSSRARRRSSTARRALDPVAGLDAEHQLLHSTGSPTSKQKQKPDSPASRPRLPPAGRLKTAVPSSMQVQMPKLDLSTLAAAAVQARRMSITDTGGLQLTQTPYATSGRPPLPPSAAGIPFPSARDCLESTRSSDDTSTPRPTITSSRASSSRLRLAIANATAKGAFRATGELAHPVVTIRSTSPSSRRPSSGTTHAPQFRRTSRAVVDHRMDRRRSSQLSSSSRVPLSARWAGARRGSRGHRRDSSSMQDSGQLQAMKGRSTIRKRTTQRMVISQDAEIQIRNKLRQELEAKKMGVGNTIESMGFQAFAAWAPSRFSRSAQTIDKFTIELLVNKCIEKICEEFQIADVTATVDHQEMWSTSELVQTLIQKLPFLAPRAPLRRTWDVVMLFAITYFAFSTPYRIAFESNFIVFIVCDVLSYLSFAVDICLNFVTGYKELHGLIQTKPDQIMLHYLKTWFFFDLLGIIPMKDLPIKTANTAFIIVPLKLFPMINCTRLWRLDRFFESREVSMAIRPTTLKILCSGIACLWWYHLIACLYWFIASREGLGSTDWTPDEEYYHHPNTLKYFLVVTWTLSTTFGNQPPTFPVRAHEALFTISAVLIGITLSSYVVGLANMALVSTDAEEEDKRLRKEKMLQFLRRHNIPYHFTKNVMDYYDNAGDRGSDVIMEALPGPIQIRLALLLNRHMLTTIPVFKTLPLNCILILMQLTSSKIYLPGTWIFSVGDEPSHLYFVRSGSVQILTESGDMPVRTLIAGDMFGHIGIFYRKEHTIGAKCIMYSEVICLDDESYDEVTMEHDVFREFVSSEVKREEKAIEAALKNFAKHKKLQRREEDKESKLRNKEKEKAVKAMKMIWGKRVQV